MKVKFRTNIDAYNRSCFPTLSLVPSIGHFIEIKPEFRSYFRNIKLPMRLEVVSVTWCEDTSDGEYVECELWYNKTDVEIAKMNKVNLFP